MTSTRLSATVLAAAFEATPAFLCILDYYGRVLCMNRFAASLLNCTAADTECQDFVGSYVEPLEREQVASTLERVGNTRQVECCSFHITTSSGARCMLNAKLAPLPSVEASECLLIVSVTESQTEDFESTRQTRQPSRIASGLGNEWNITSRHRAKEALQWTTAFLSSMANSAALGFLVVDDRTDQVLYANRRFCELWNLRHLEREILCGRLTNSEIVPHCIPELLEPHAFAESCMSSHAEHNRATVEEDISFLDGRTVRRFSTQMRGPDGEYFGRVYIFEDVSRQRQLESDLRSSESNFRTFFQSIADMVFVATPDGRILFANDATRRILGYESPDLLKMHVLDLHPRKSRAAAEAAYQAMFSGASLNSSVPFARENGDLVQVEIRTWFGQWNGNDCFYGIAKDLTAEHDARLRFESLFRNNPALMAVLDVTERRFVDVNEAVLSTLGYTRREFTEKTTLELGIFVDPEMRVRRKDGAILHGLFSGEFIRSGQQVYLLVVMIDITERKAVENNLAQERLRLASIIEGTHVGTWEWNVQTGEVILNEIWAELVGYSLAELSPTNIATWTRLVHPDDLAHSNEQLARHFSGELAYYDCHCRIRHKSGNWIWAHDRGKVVSRTADNQPLMMYGTHSDVTSQKLIEEHLRESNKWLEQTTARANELAARAELANAAKTQFLANMSHEIRTPMNGVIGMLELLSGTELSTEQRRFTELAQSSGKALLVILNDILDISKIEARRLVLENVAFDPVNVATELIAAMALQACSKGIALHLAIDPDTPQCCIGDPGRLRQILANLVGNAVKFTLHGEVAVKLQLLASTPTHATLHFVVEDTGIGIPEDQMAQVFQKFTQVDASMTRRFGGTGLGLAISRELVTIMGGTIGVTSEIGKGSTFWFTVSFAQCHSPARAGSEAHDPPTQLDNPSVKKEVAVRTAAVHPPLRVLIVEDNAANQLVAKGLLAKLGVESDLVSDGNGAIEALACRNYTFVLMDVQMPVLDGLETTEMIRSGTSRALDAAIPIIAMTAHASPADQQRCLMVGMSEYIAKPVTSQKLLDVLHRWASNWS
ncbi:MAG TPA: PAS domain S-box protein [Polyangiaceae bacterium]